MIYLCGATGARRSRVWSDHSRTILGPWSDRFRIINGVSSVFRACAVDKITLWFATLGSFPQCKWNCKWCWWMGCQWLLKDSCLLQLDLGNRLGVAAWRLRNKIVLHFGTRVVFVACRFRAVWSVKRKDCSVKCEVWRNQWEVKSVKCGVWSVKCGVWSLSLECEARSVKCEVWRVECEGSSGKWEARSVKCEVWSVEGEVSRLESENLSLKKSNGCRGKDTVWTGCLWTIGHLCLENFHRRLARVYVTVQCTLSWNRLWPPMLTTHETPSGSKPIGQQLHVPLIATIS